MSTAITEVLRSRKGVAEALGMTLIVMTLLIAAGGVIVNYALLSKQAANVTSLSNEITNRAEAYAAALNADLTTPQAPATARQCSTTTQVCTQVLSATASGSDKLVLRIQADSVGVMPQTATQDVQLFASEVTHITAVDSDNSNVWALTDEGLRFRVWNLAEGGAKDVSEDGLSTPTTGLTWASVDDRAGIDSAGSLWVWGKNDIGQAGVGSTSTTAVAPKKVAANFRYVVTEDDRSYAIDSSGRLWAWGKNNAGQLGLGHTNTVTKPTLVTALSGTRFLTVAIGKDNALALTNSGQIRVAGRAQAGFTDTTSSTWRTLATGQRVTSLAASSVDGTVALLDDGGTVRVNGSPLAAPAGVTFTSVAKGSTAGYAISTSGELYVFGTGANGELGLGATTTVSALTKAPGTPKVISVQGSRSGALAITATGELYFAGKVHRPFEGAGPVASSTKFVALTPGKAFRQIAGNPGDETYAIKDKDGNLLSAGGKTAGLWPMNWLGGNDQIVRMPAPDGFASYTWE